jgi:hypothetical protein
MLASYQLISHDASHLLYACCAMLTLKYAQPTSSCSSTHDTAQANLKPHVIRKCCLFLHHLSQAR